ncbi:hypothetical protein GCM10010326_72820 [Streptomyces xanthochromogenes]|uniref:Transposase n=1 Tax=Streptomyces xanthochromogenes TaxID=67384 RepID=A0ABQ3AUI2_9ACTN|nr:hypothetical protein GCM10010326_72820 [Streptomyces xanthochromogenes]
MTMFATFISSLACRPVRYVEKPHSALRETSGTSNNATIFLRMDFPRKRMASPRSTVNKRREPTTDT